MTEKWERALADYRRYLGEQCVVRGELSKPDPTDADADAEKLRRFIESHTFLTQLAPDEITDAHCQMLAHAGCTWPPESDTAAWHWRRATLLTRNNYVCEYCKRTAWPSGQRSHALRMEVEHMRARSKSKSEPSSAEAWDNLTVACRSCNVVKGQAEVDVFRAELFDLAEAVVRLKAG